MHACDLHRHSVLVFFLLLRISPLRLFKTKRKGSKVCVAQPLDHVRPWSISQSVEARSPSQFFFYTELSARDRFWKNSHARTPLTVPVWTLCTLKTLEQADHTKQSQGSHGRRVINSCVRPLVWTCASTRASKSNGSSISHGKVRPAGDRDPHL